MKVQDIIIWVLFIITIIVSIWYVFGSSPTLEQALLILIITILFTQTTKISNIEARLGLIEKRFNNLERSFIKLVNDFKLQKRGKNEN